MAHWEDQSHDAMVLKSGTVTIGLVVLRFDGAWVWQLYGVDVKWTGHSLGESVSRKRAKAALVRQWRRWLDAARLAER